MAKSGEPWGPRALRLLNLADLLGTKVSLKVGARNKGQLIIDFHDWEHLNSLLERQGLSSVLEN